MSNDEALVLGPLPAPLRDPLGTLRRRGWLMAGVLALGLAVTYSAVRWGITPVYTAHSTVLVANPTIARDFVRPTTGKDDAPAHLNAMVSTALAREHLVDLIYRFDLYPQLRREAPMDLVVVAFRRDIEIRPERGVAPKGFFAAPELFRIGFRYSDPRVAAAVANAITETFTLAGTQLRSEQARLTANVLGEEVMRAEQELELHRAQVAELRGRSYDRRHVRELQKELDTLRESLAEQLTLYTEEHPSVVSLRSRVNRLRAEIRRESGGTSSGFRRQLETAVQKEEALEKRHSEMLGKLREAEVAAGVEARGRNDRTVIMEPATAPTIPSRGRRSYYAAGALLSAALAAALGLLREVRDPVLISSEAMELEYDIPVLGSVPRIS